MPSELRLMAGILGSGLLFISGVCGDKGLPWQQFVLVVIAAIWLLTAFLGDDL